SWQLVRRTVKSLHAVSVGVERLARGDIREQIEVPAGDEIGDLAREANLTAVRLREYRGLIEGEAWIQTGLAELADRIAGELDPVTLGHNALVHVATYVGAGAAAIYVVDDGGAFRLLERYGVDPETPARGAFRLGETALGEVAASGKVRVDALASDNVLARPGSNATLDHHVLVPLIHDARTLGMIELAIAGAPNERTLTLLNRVRSALGIAFEVAESRQEAQMLLVETQRQALAAETANKELEAFSYSVSHDLRAPLRGIDGFSQALVEDEAPNLTDRGKDYLRRIRAAAQRMAELIDDLLQLSRVSRSDFKKERVDLSALVGTVLGELQRADPERKVELIIQRNVFAIADARLIRITLENLLGNAWKFTSKAAQARIEFGSFEKEDEQVYFVRDNGAGFDMQYVQRLFGAFQRLHTDKEFPGTGIGLATVQRVVHRHGGKIWVEAEIGKGAMFQFTLPARANIATTSRTATRDPGG
ncbi:MAG: ATP-binding protein, partial [Kofleriaceae bacterium]